ncbi:hypothetical protein FE275_00345, partial [Pseudomonas koreensis]
MTGFLVIDERVQGLAPGQGWGKAQRRSKCGSGGGGGGPGGGGGGGVWGAPPPGGAPPPPKGLWVGGGVS